MCNRALFSGWNRGACFSPFPPFHFFSTYPFYKVTKMINIHPTYEAIIHKVAKKRSHKKALNEIAQFVSYINERALIDFQNIKFEKLQDGLARLYRMHESAINEIAEEVHRGDHLFSGESKNLFVGFADKRGEFRTQGVYAAYAIAIALIKNFNSHAV